MLSWLRRLVAGIEHGVGAPTQPLARGQGYAGSATARSSLSPFATIRSTSFGKGRCRASASVVSASSHWSTSAPVVRMTGIAFGWTGATIALASVVRKANNSWTTLDGRTLGASHTPPRRPEAGEGEQRPILAQREPDRRLARLGVQVLAERRGGDDASVPVSEPSAPIADCLGCGCWSPALRHTAAAPAFPIAPSRARAPYRYPCGRSGPSDRERSPAGGTGCRRGRGSHETGRGSPIGPWSRCRGCT